MSAAATTEAVPVGDAVPAQVVANRTQSTFEMEAAEQKRWMTWIGIPALIAAVFVGMTFGTGHAWWLGLAIVAIIADIFVLVWLAMTSDTNGLIGDSPAH